ncbi:MAG TPA: DNA-3-methyladenine glycosylase [Candidatus Paceibacterota bacterium]|nr:DNA-3-methyladenine glycosylase [Candidatus Paceibacterota bacterium]
MYHLAKKHFKTADPRLHEAAKQWDIEDIVVSADLFRDIVWTIVGQQLSSTAANTIYARFEKLFPRGRVTPEQILALADEQMRASGLSGAKTRAIKNVAAAVRQGELDMKKIAALPDAEVVATLTRVKGIGPWTAEMVLMFSLGRTDIFSPGDLGLRKGVVALYDLKQMPDEKKLLKIAKAWSPYRTYAARVLWKLADKNTQRVARKRPGNKK